MKAIEGATGGVWQKVDGIYALAPDPAVERVAKLIEPYRIHWLREAITAVSRDLTSRQRSTLKKGGKLEPASLSARQRNNLRWATAVAFVVDENVSADALSLKDVALRYEKAARLPVGPDLQLVLPSRSGKEIAYPPGNAD